jgi:hypothetical protein
MQMKKGTGGYPCSLLYLEAKLSFLTSSQRKADKVNIERKRDMYNKRLSQEREVCLLFFGSKDP